ncbi:MAG TPA: SRPBCC domain-containing protein [Burkholderiales bacterium]|nr:SRPBCC domain-containing protein [Burkholderiales bacterium]
MKPRPHAHARVTRRFSASPERVFDAWLQPEMIGRWMLGPRVPEDEVVRLALDARVGGSFSFAVRRQGDPIDYMGEYLEINRPRRLVFTWSIRQDAPDSSHVIVDIAPTESGCELSLTHELPADRAGYASRTEAAWTEMLDALAAALQ